MVTIKVILEFLISSVLYFRIGSHEVWDDIDEDHLIETLALHEVSETNPMGKIQDLMAENHALVEANKRLTNFVMKNIPK